MNAKINIIVKELGRMESRPALTNDENELLNNIAELIAKHQTNEKNTHTSKKSK